VQLNDTHPAVGIAELMRLLVDDHDLGWDDAWHITRNARLHQPHAAARGAGAMAAGTVPPHPAAPSEIIYEINARFLDECASASMATTRLARLSLSTSSGRFVRMAGLACVGSHAINGVAELHSRLMREDVLQDFHAMWPEKFTSITNGVTPRRWLALSNPRLTRLVGDAIGDGWIKDLEQLQALEPFADDAGFANSGRPCGATTSATWRADPRPHRRVGGSGHRCST
jgi:starch phosphorylase